MFKRILLCLFLFVLFTPGFTQNSPQTNAEIVILVDTSGTILPYYEDINNRVLAEINDKFVRKGDNVHVLSFNADARYEMSQKINSEKDMSRLVSRFLLLYQLGKSSDFLTGLQYARQYGSNLPETKEKILIIISDGIFNPPASSPYKNYSDDQIKNEIGLLAGGIRKKGWKVYYVKLPYPADAVIRNLDGEEFYNPGSGYAGTGAAGGSGMQGSGGSAGGSSSSGTSGSASGGGGYSGGSSGTSGTAQGGSGNAGTGQGSLTDVSQAFKDASGASNSELSKDKNDAFTINENSENLPLIDFPDDGLEAHGNKLAFSFGVTNNAEEDVELHLTHIVMDNGTDISKIPVDSQNTKIKSGEKNVLIKVSAVLPEEYKEGNYNLIMRLEFAEGKRVLPQVMETSLSVFPTGFGRLKDSNALWFILLAVLLLLLIIFLIVFFARRRSSSSYSNQVRYAGAGSQPNYQEEDKRYPHKLSEEDDHASRLNAFNSASNTSIYSENKNFAGDGSSIYSSDSLNRLAAQKQDDEALRRRVLAASFAAKQPRGTYMSPANFFETIEIKRNQSGMTEIYVLNQNRNIGRRNIHIMKPGTSLTLGGGKMDDFLIFLVPFPAHLAQVRYDGQDYHLAILKPKYFPYETSNIVNNCIGKTITIVSDKGYHVYFTFREYENPTEKLNGILTSIKYD
ncbi:MULTISPECIES: vWA domain-containing protein [unclassified Treponema]|uniref:vWA domain-containing protein n=1 Tax=unclassified Treponema TaxID=2638727 RepID=UPI0020A36856|nr:MULTISPECIES: vWA domain-containing protein [unclassified Treponema]UTC67133.1 VWA domain-containing protein [Treponema sp. OMZ 789]UTC69864.1 VWA domain-containing protein [Treponema sp. OMZ 790]UTC72578.1 VWA domain-containing protein [Treponema sp. OMZ 791]